MTAPRRLLLVGAGHAHLEILRRLAATPQPGLAVTVVSPVDRHVYSGMVPGFVAGQYSFEELSIDVAAIAQRAGATLVRLPAIRFDPAQHLVHLQDGHALEYDLACFNVGSRTFRGDDADVHAHALLLKPFDRIRQVRTRLESLAVTPPHRQARVVVVGAGAAGFEIACAADAVLGRAGRRGAVTLVEAGARILPGYSARVLTVATALLAQRGIALMTQQRVAAVAQGAVVLESGKHLDAELVLWLAGTTSLPLFQGCGLPLDTRGFLLVDAMLRSVADPCVLAIGDCATLAEYPDTPKAGVYAVRQAPVLWRNLGSLSRGESPATAYVPQSSFLSLLNTCDGRAVLRYKFITAHARWAWRLKDRIDRSFMREYQEPYGQP